jgi:hypothetical protein
MKEKTNNSEALNTKYRHNDRKPLKPIGPKKGARAQKQFMLDWLSDNQEVFTELMQDARVQDPRLFVQTYTTIMKHVVPQDKNVNVNVGINKDFLELQAMGRTNVELPDKSGVTMIPSELPHYTQYEEIVAEENASPELEEEVRS